MNSMKRIGLMIFAAIALFAAPGCQDRLEEDFIDPSIYAPNENITARMFSSLVTGARTFRSDYGEIWGHAGPTGFLGLTQLSYRSTRGESYSMSTLNNIDAQFETNYTSGYFNWALNFKNLPYMTNLVAEQSGDDRTDSEIYLTIANLLKDWRASKAIDMFNAIPYYQTLEGADGLFYPEIDDPQEVYIHIIEQMTASTELIKSQYSAMTPLGKSTFTKQDIIFGGDINKWVQFSAALRLRLSMRVSGVLESFASEQIAAVVASGDLPQADLLVEAATWITGDKVNAKRGFAERDYAGFLTPFHARMMDTDFDHKYTEGVDDPRLPILWMPNRDGNYMPVPFDGNLGEEIHNEMCIINEDLYDIKRGYNYYDYYGDGTYDTYAKINMYSTYNAATLIRNNDPTKAFTAAEVDLLLAEASLKGLGGLSAGSASDYVKSAVEKSIAYWYNVNKYNLWADVNETNASFLTPNDPSASATFTFAQSIADEYSAASGVEDKMEVIMRQKHLHLNVHDHIEVWTEMRRTAHPKLPMLAIDGELINTPVRRITYPAALLSTMPYEYNKVAAEDDLHHNIFWVPADKQTEKHYMDVQDKQYVYIEYPGFDQTYAETSEY